VVVGPDSNLLKPRRVVFDEISDEKNWRGILERYEVIDGKWKGAVTYNVALSLKNAPPPSIFTTQTKEPSETEEAAARQHLICGFVSRLRLCLQARSRLHK
jgi:hypothetical protein